MKTRKEAIKSLSKREPIEPNQHCEDLIQKEMNMTPTSLPLPWSLEQKQTWPYTLTILDANAHAVVWQDLYSFSTQDKTIEQVNRREGNAEQLARLNFIVNAANRSALFEEMLEIAKVLCDMAKKDLRPSFERLEDYRRVIVKAEAKS